MRRCASLVLLAAAATSGAGCDGRPGALGADGPINDAGIQTAANDVPAPPGAREFGSALVTAGRVGPISGSSSRADLAATFGDAAVVDQPYYIGEGFCVPGAVVLAGTPDALAVAWQDADMRAVAAVSIRAQGGAWKTPSGVKVGSSLAELESLNGGPFAFSGFGWDYGGTVGDWLMGRLDQELRDVTLRLNADQDALLAIGAPENETLFGERIVRSDSSVARRAGIAVEEIFVALGPLPDEFSCE